MVPVRRRSTVLRGHTPDVLRSAKLAFEHSERSFSRLDYFKFDSQGPDELVSSGPRRDRWSMVLVSSTGHSIALRDDDRLSFLFPYRGTIEISSGSKTITAKTTQMIAVGDGPRKTRLSRDYLGALIQIPRLHVGRLDELVRHRFEGGALSMTSPDILSQISTHNVIAQAHLCLETLENRQPHLAHADAWQRLVLPLWEAFATMSDGNRQVAPASLRQVKCAEAFMEANCGSDLGLTELAQVSGVGARALQLAFQRHRRATPILSHLRLERARARLLHPNAGDRVTRVATACGFFHLGRFASSYRKAFEVSPAQTLRDRSNSGKSS
jgi:AraC-like DNA-binding protein